MTGTVQKREFKYRLYFRLMDIAFAAMLLGLADFFRDHVFGVWDGIESSPLYSIVALFIAIAGFVIGPILIVGRSMRDEYAEQLWTRTARAMMPILALVPVAIFFGVTLLRTIIGGDGPPVWLEWLFADLTVFRAIRIGGGWFIILFVVTFQFLRWKDSR